MNLSKLVAAGAAVVLIALIAFYAVGGFNSSQPGQYDEFAKCLSEKGVKMYGAYWCPHCENQKELFGSSWRFVNYIECSLPGGSGQTDFCNQQGIRGYPTWEFAASDRVSGEMTLEQLSQKTGCALR